MTTWCTYRKSKMLCFNITVFCCCVNFFDKKYLTYLIKQTLHVHFVKPIKWLDLFLSYNWIMQLLKTVSAIFLYQQMKALYKLRKMLFISSKKLFFILKVFKVLYFSYPLFFPMPNIAWEDDKNEILNFMTLSIV